MGVTRRPGDTGPEATEALYDCMTAYGFARRFVEGKVVADIGREGLGHGSRLLARLAASVVGLTPSAEHAELASNAYPAPNAEYKKVDLPKLPYPDDHFDVVVALGVADILEPPGDLLSETRRVLKGDGVLVVTARDRGTVGDEPGGVYVPEFRELLEEHFGSVDLYRLGTVAGGLVSPVPEGSSEIPAEGASLTLTDPDIGAGLPTTRSVLAVCRPTAGSPEAEEPYLLLDRDRRLLHEAEDHAEDVELLREEVRRMQRTEVQAFQNSLKLYSTEAAQLRAQVRDLRAQVRDLRMQVHKAMAEARRARQEVRDMQGSTTWRIFEPYRRLRVRVDAVRKRGPGEAG